MGEKEEKVEGRGRAGRKRDEEVEGRGGGEDGRKRSRWKGEVDLRVEGRGGGGTRR